MFNLAIQASTASNSTQLLRCTLKILHSCFKCS